jgi:hypothetical protein
MTPIKVTEKIDPGHGHKGPHYHVGTWHGHSKIAALRKAQELGHACPGFRVWSHSLARPRPQKTFWQLCLDQARLIRDCHSRIRLWYSGGMDSHAALIAFLETGADVDEIAVYRRFPGAIDDYVNIEIDVFPFRETLSRVMLQYQSRAQVVYYDILPEHYSWYMQEVEHRWIQHKTLTPCTSNPLQAMECYPHTLDDQFVNVGGAAQPILVGNEFYWVDGRFNLNFMTPRMIHFFCDQRNPDLAFAYAYGMHDLHQQGVLGLDVKAALGLPIPGNGLDKKWTFPRINGQVSHQQDWRFCRKELLLVSNCGLSDQGKLNLARFEKYCAELELHHAEWFNGGLVSQDYIGSVSERHTLLDL